MSKLVRARITLGNGEVWFATCPPSDLPAAKQIALCNMKAFKRGVTASYALATEEEYQAYRDKVRAKVPSLG